MRVALIYDDVSARPNASADDLSILETIDAVDDALIELGHTPLWIPVPPRVDGWIEILMHAAIDVVFNLCEGVGGETANETRVANVVELLKLPMTGCTADTLNLTRHKHRVNALLRHAGLPVPDWAEVRVTERRLYWDRFPAIVKPAAEDASIGITQASVVRNRRELARAIDAAERFGSVIVQKFVEGRELNVGMVGNVVLPVSEIDFTDMPAGAWRMVSYAAKWEEGSPDYIGTQPRCPAEITEEQRETLVELAREAWRVVNGRGYGRVDLRMDGDGNPWILEVNPNPDLAPVAGLTRMATVRGWSYADLIQRILDEAV